MKRKRVKLPTDAPPATKRRGYALMTGPRKKRRVYARFPASCAVCGKRHIEVGDEIVKDALGWASPRCLSKRDSPSKIEDRVKRFMLSLHKVALGTWGIPDGVTGTDSYAEFFGMALERGVCTRREHEVMQRKHGAIWTEKI